MRGLSSVLWCIVVYCVVLWLGDPSRNFNKSALVCLPAGPMLHVFLAFHGAAEEEDLAQACARVGLGGCEEKESPQRSKTGCARVRVST